MATYFRVEWLDNDVPQHIQSSLQGVVCISRIILNTSVTTDLFKVIGELYQMVCRARIGHQEEDLGGVEGEEEGEREGREQEERRGRGEGEGGGKEREEEKEREV